MAGAPLAEGGLPLASMPDRGRVGLARRRDRHELEAVGGVQVAMCGAGRTQVAVLPDDTLGTRVDDHDALVVVVVDRDHAVRQHRRQAGMVEPAPPGAWAVLPQ